MDYENLQNNDYFDFYGLFSYYKLSFQQDQQLFTTIQKAEECEILKSQIADPQYTTNWKLFSINYYPQRFELKNIVKYSLQQTKQKLYTCKQFGVQFKESYFYVLALRALLFQPSTFEQTLQQMSKRLYPWIAFDVFLKKKQLVLFFNFIDHVYCEIYDGDSTKTIHFVQLEKVTYGFQLDEVILTKNNKCVVYRARYQEQRNFIAEVFRFAISRDLEIKLLSHFINPNDSDFRAKMIEQENSLKLVQQSTFKLIRNDRVIPPSPILTYKGRIIGEYLQTPLYGNFTFSISLGQNNIVQHKHPQIFVTVIPYMSDQFYIEETQCQTCLGLHVGKQLNYAYFGTSQERENFNLAIQARRRNQISMDVLFIHFESDSLERLTQFKRIKLKEINGLIDQQEQTLQQLQQIKNELEIDVIEGELNSAVKMKQTSFFNQTQQTEVSAIGSPSFLQSE